MVKMTTKRTSHVTQLLDSVIETFDMGQNTVKNFLNNREASFFGAKKFQREVRQAHYFYTGR